MQASSYHPWLRHYLSFYSSSLIIILGQIFFQPKVLRETSLAKAQQTTIYDLQFPEHFFRPIYCSCFCSSTTYLHMKRAFVLLNPLVYVSVIYSIHTSHFFVNQLKTRIFSSMSKSYMCFVLAYLCISSKRIFFYIFSPLLYQTCLYEFQTFSTATLYILMIEIINFLKSLIRLQQLQL